VNLNDIERFGFTGTREGTTLAQITRLEDFFRKLRSAKEFHHGGAPGADTEAHEISFYAHPLIKVHLHPGNGTPEWWSEGPAIVVYPRKPYFERDEDIVNAVQLLFACPRLPHEEVRSGTWTTVRYARRNNVPRCIIYPDGSHKYEQAR